MLHRHPVLAPIAFTILTVGAVRSQTPAGPFPILLGNTSALPTGWSGFSQCMADCTFTDLPITTEFMSGPAFTDVVGLTIESCVQFCDAQGSRMAGLKGTECRCANIYNPRSCFESDDPECSRTNIVIDGCPGNRRESCGSATTAPPMFNTFWKEQSQFACSYFIWPGGAALTAVGSWRFSYFYNDSAAARALPVNAVDLQVSLPQGNLTTTACVTACGNAGFTLAGVEFADECFCGNALQNGAHPITNCSMLPINPNLGGNGKSDLMRCTGNSREFCGGPNIISIYTLPGTGLVPITPFDSGFDQFCSGFDCVGNV